MALVGYRIALNKQVRVLPYGLEMVFKYKIHDGRIGNKNYIGIPILYFFFFIGFMMPASDLQL